jgi:hypothetical protein
MQRRAYVTALMALAMLAAVTAASVMAQQRRTVTVKEMFALNHQLEIDVGTEVVWADPHFDRIWFPRGAGPSLRRTESGMAAIFDKPGKYQGVFTVAGGHGTADVYSMTIVVKGRPQ